MGVGLNSMNQITGGIAAASIAAAGIGEMTEKNKIATAEAADKFNEKQLGLKQESIDLSKRESKLAEAQNAYSKEYDRVAGLKRPRKSSLEMLSRSAVELNMERAAIKTQWDQINQHRSALESSRKDLQKSMDRYGIKTKLIGGDK